MTQTKGIQIGILTFGNDLHALAVRSEIESSLGGRVHVFETPVPTDGILNWELSAGQRPITVIRDDRGDLVDVSKLSAVWLRRLNQPQVFHPLGFDDLSERLINGSWRSSTLGAFLTSFSGIWINDPLRILAAENKLFQLDMAQKAGLKIPRTLVSQDPERVRAFCQEVGGQVVVKAASALRRKALVAVSVSTCDLQDDDSISACPCIYQELVEGTDHLRVLTFGGQSLGVKIETEDLDWRRDLNVPFSQIEVSADLNERLCTFLDAIGLKMGIFDLKRMPDGTEVWLEVNPQGQFLFAEGLSGLDMLKPFSSWLMDQAQSSSLETQLSV